MSDSDAIDGGGNDSDSDPIAGDDAASERRPAGQRASPAKRCMSVVLLASTHGYWAAAFEGLLNNHQALIDASGEGIIVVGLAFCCWDLHAYSGNENPRLSLLMQHAARIVGTGVCVSHAITYEALHVALLHEFLPIGPGLTNQEVWNRVQGLQTSAGMSMCGVHALWHQRLRKTRHVPVLFHGCHKLIFDIGMQTSSWMHAVAVTQRINRHRLIGDTPSNRVLKAFRLSSLEGGVALATMPIQLATPHVQAVAVDVVLDWLGATRFLMQLHQAPQATKAYARLFARGGRGTASELLSELPCVSRERLRSARVRLDCVAMMVWRAFFATLPVELTHIYIWADASPQWRGLEIYAASFDVITKGLLFRRMLPLVSLKRGGGAIEKVCALLWQIFLMVGPGEEIVRAFCSRVRAITTDMGTERLIPSYQDILPDFFETIVRQRRCRLPKLSKLFPRALHAPGWRHTVDLLLKRGLYMLPWLPLFMVRLKALCKFFREKRDDIIRNFTASGHIGFVAVFKQSSIPPFAHWRWTSVNDTCKGVRPFIVSFCAHFDPVPFKNAKDTTTLKHVREACASNTFMMEFNFVAWFAGEMGLLLSWGGSCTCHPYNGADGSVHIKCWRSGRLVEVAYEYAMTFLRKMLDGANSWTAETYQGDSQFLRQVQCCIRATFALGEEKFEYLDLIPWLFARLHHPGVRDRCVAQYRNAPAGSHSDVSHDFLHPDGPLEASVMQIQPDGSGGSPVLDAEITSIQDASLLLALNLRDIILGCLRCAR